MAQIFPKWTNNTPPIIAAVVLFGAVMAVGFVWYYGSPEYTDVGYRPIQPVQYSHKLHAGDFGFDCRYCHTSVEVSTVSSIPPTNTCMNCHKIILTNSEKLHPVRESYTSGMPIEWKRIHDLPDYAYFNHSAHTRAGVGCFSCHGNVAGMEVVTQVEPLSMGWCLDCHREPDQHLRPLSEITNMKWTPPENQAELALKYKMERNISPPVDCSGCHR